MRIDGYWSGYYDYRKGGGKKVSLAPVSMIAPPPKKRSRNEEFVSAVMSILGDWRFSPFEHEGATRQALRAWFIERGHCWELSDAEAAALVSTALDAMGAKRPTWLQGQWHYTEGRDLCVWCAAPIAEEDRTRGYRFCSSVCAKSSMENRISEAKKYDNWFRKRAYFEITTRSSQQRPCKVCGTLFRSKKAQALTCSKACNRAMKGDILPDISCAWCNNVFHPLEREQRYCCKACGTKGMIRDREAALPAEKSCECCRAVFRPKTSFALYCSPRCRSLMASRADWARRKAQRNRSTPIFTLEIFDGWFKRAA